MTLQEATNLIRAAHLGDGPQSWADLGCGSGLFSRALASLLPAESRVLAVDQKSQNPGESPKEGTRIEFRRADFTNPDFSLSGYQGILMANSLHYVRDQKAFLQGIYNWLEPGGQLIVVEYDTERGNPWVPYPVSFRRLPGLLPHSEQVRIAELGEHPSRYGHKRIYACSVQWT